MGKADTRFGASSRPSAETVEQRLANVRRRRRERDGRGWLIVRTNGRRTLALASSLSAAGIEAWSPRETIRKRIPRCKAYRERDAAIVPSFVFVREEYLPDLMRVLAMPSNPHGSFSIFQNAGRAPVIADRDIAALEAEEDRRRRALLRTRHHQVEIGTKVCPTEGAFAGLDGVVEQVEGKDAMVCFNGSFRVKIASWLLIDDDVKEASSRKGAAALAA